MYTSFSDISSLSVYSSNSDCFLSITVTKAAVIFSPFVQALSRQTLSVASEKQITMFEWLDRMNVYTKQTYDAMSKSEKIANDNFGCESRMHIHSVCIIFSAMCTVTVASISKH